MGHSETSEIFEEIYQNEKPDIMIEDEFEELPEEVEELVEEEDLSDNDASGSLLYEALFSSEKAKYQKVSVPVLFLTNNLKIHWINQAGINFIDSRGPVLNNYLHSVFSPYLNENRMNEVYSNILSKEKGFAWRGKVELSGRHRITAVANMVIFPYFDCRTGSLKPEGYISYIDDITEENNQLIRNTFKSLLDASKFKDDDTGNHIERVNRYSYKIASLLYNRPGYEEVDMDFIMNIEFLAAMHDVGKIGTPDHILHKPGPLTDEEWKIMREHPINGALILNSYPNKMAAEIAKSHHEKWDGSGYPYNLSGIYIPLSARIVAIADVYDALRMKRSYKDSFSHEKAFSIIKEGRGKHFDPDLIDVCCEIEKDMDLIFSNLTDSN